MRSAFVAALCALAAGCDPPPAPETDAGFPEPKSRSETYDQTCDSSTDCLIVAFATCNPCGSCGDVAINIDEKSRFDGDNELDCPPRESGVACGACAELRATCEDSACVLHDCSTEACP